jgi:antitoxin PrlF
MEITQDGSVTIPPHIQEQLGLLPGTEIELTVVGNTLQRQKKNGSNRGQALIARMRGKATAPLSTHDIMQLTRDTHD